ncbi:putative F0F1-ATPase subunit [Alteromonas sp. 38]|uniref:AtpZ/AtpI family protein n=1 Tax=Alteromonas TaxID=226 RepID=UPI0012F13975|nr:MULTISPECIES: AtpZ/AtpI family protein [Alteromonas]CAD5273285.1 putative F0F1-ATPase subunit [Alteromonas sp. 154]VXB55828.1 putative F0F1-ATPase subunit [Alteromonas sp. 38]
MDKPPIKAKNNKTPRSQNMSHQVEKKVALKLYAKRHKHPGVWFGLGLMGIVGWSVALPTLLGIALGIWLDASISDSRAYTLIFLLAGLTLGCFIAWNWVSKEYAAMHSPTVTMKANTKAPTKANTVPKTKTSKENE